jgi:hypothetical protein
MGPPEPRRTARHAFGLLSSDATGAGWWLALGCVLAATAGFFPLEPSVAKAEDKWIELNTLEVFQPKHQGWEQAQSVRLDPANPRRLAFSPGQGILVNGRAGNAPDLVTVRRFGDVEVHVEFFIAKRSNSGVKFQGLYEIQIEDSFGKREVTASDCGGVYPRAELLPRYHHLDKGVPPQTNAAHPAGEWQALDAVFRAPRFARDGKKTANARLVKAVLNGKLIHEDVELKTPTGHAWRNPETATGPLLLQGDHGPVAFRNVRVRTLDPTTAKP